MNFAVISSYLAEKDNCFDISIHKRDMIEYVPYLQQRYFIERGHQYHTLDMYDDIRSVDYILCNDFNRRAWIHAFFHGYVDKLIYCVIEPEFVVKFNAPDNFPRILKGYRYILAANSDLVDNVRVIKAPPVSYYFHPIESTMPWTQKKLIASISGYKFAHHPNELYSERMRVIQYFEDRNDQRFEQYGEGNWGELGLKCYKGSCKSKADIYQRFKFALCLENIKDTKGYLSEKILDCFCAQIVPIYYGPPDTSEYIPDECYINYCNFSSIEQLVDFLENMTEQQHAEYIAAAQCFLKSDKRQVFEPEYFCKQMMRVAEIDQKRPVYQSIWNKIYFLASILIDKLFGNN